MSGESAVLIWLGDQVGFMLNDARRLIGAWDRDSSRIVASSYNGTLGVPAIFPCDDFPQLMNLHGDQGAKGLLLRNLDRTTLVEIPTAAIDIDTPDVLRNYSPDRD